MQLKLDLADLRLITGMGFSPAPNCLHVIAENIPLPMCLPKDVCRPSPAVSDPSAYEAALFGLTVVSVIDAVQGEEHCLSKCAIPPGGLNSRLSVFLVGVGPICRNGAIGRIPVIGIPAELRNRRKVLYSDRPGGRECGHPCC